MVKFLFDPDDGAIKPVNEFIEPEDEGPWALDIPWPLFVVGMEPNISGGGVTIDVTIAFADVKDAQSYEVKVTRE